MKSKLFFLGAVSLLLASCSNELDMPVNEALVEGKTPLSVNVLANPSTKAFVNSTALPGGSKIGVKLVDASGATYDNQTYNNIFYSTTNGTTWDIDGSKSIKLSATEGTAYAYYPYSDGVSDFKAISISSASNPNDQIDYMYGNVATGLKNSNPTASFTMSHAMAILNFEIAKGSYTGTGSITSVKMKGNTASNTGTMNAEAGTVTATNKGYEFVSTSALTLGNSSTGKFIVVPSGESSQLDFKLVMDGQTYTASTTSAVTLESGKVYKYTLTMSSTGLTVNTVTVTPWGDVQDQGSLDTDLYKPILTWEEAKTKDGVYGMMVDGNAMIYEAASTTSEILTGVAFVIKGKAYQVAKMNARGYSGDSNVCWHTTGYSDISGLTNYSTVDGTSNRTRGYLAGTSTPQLSKDPSTWTAGALSDFNGQANTAAILAAQNNGADDYTIGKAVMDFRSGSNNEDHNDWFVPSCGELAYMLLKKTELNTLLGKVSGGVKISADIYWSSSEYYTGGSAWNVSFFSSAVDFEFKGTSGERVRLVRAI